MQPKTRLYLCGFMIVFSAIYAALVSVNPRVASAVALGYIAVLLTVFFATTLWRRP
jgi:hypothetical protein